MLWKASRTAFAVSCAILIGLSQVCRAAEKPSPNEALAELAKQIILESFPDEYAKSDNWGHQKEFLAGYHWVHRGGRWHFDKRMKQLNDGRWRKYRLWLIDPAETVQVRFTKPKPADEGRTKFSVFLTAKLGIDARQEQWRRGIKGLNFHVEADAAVEVRLDVEIGLGPGKGDVGSIELQPRVRDVGLRLVKLTLRRLDKIHGDLARELGNATEDIIAGELRKREAEVTKKINAEIKKNRAKLTFSPSEIADIGWEKFQALLGVVDET